jgi:radial spoke head protein 4A
MSADEAAKTYLSQEGVYDHLGKIINKVIAEKPQDAYGLVEVLSRLVKEPAAPGKPEASPEETAALAKHVKQLRKLDQVPTDESGPVQLCSVPDFSREASLLAWAGAGFSDTESYQIACALRALAFKEKDNGLTKLRFWGKVLGTEADYYVAEAQKDAPGDAPDPEGPDADMEPLGSGANTYAYYATTDLCGDWLLLPDVRPREIRAARQIKKILSGNPKAPVITHPYFEGKEEVLLRAQIARITADTVLCIKGYIKREDDEDEESPFGENPEFVAPLPAELLKPEAWTHMQPHILRIGRTTYPEGDDEEPEEGEEPTPEQVAKKELKEADPMLSLVRGLHEDGMEWSIRQSGDDAVYRGKQDPETQVYAKTSNAVTYVRSLNWPGAVCVSCGNHFANFYVGYGQPATRTEFFIPAPPDVQDEPVDPGEQVEPQGSAETAAEEPAEE